MKKKIIILFSLIISFIVIVSLTQHPKDSYDSAANAQLLNATYKTYIPIKYETDKGYKDRVFYEIFVRSFNDSNHDSVGDLKGITQKLDYLKELGVSGIWLMPINESPTYHGYDVANYYKIQKDYGTMDDFYELINEAHKRDIEIVMDLVINHTSTSNPWFSEALNNKTSKYRDYYIWSDSGKNPPNPSTLHSNPWRYSKSGKYYALFDTGMPDLNYDNPEVRSEIKNVAKYYLDMGVDGFRLDAARHIYDGEPDKNFQWWKEFNDYVKGINKNAVLVGEVWDKAPVVGDYLTSLDSAFNFDLSTAILDAVKGGNINSLGGTVNDITSIYQSKNKNYLDSIFLTNHDMNRVMSTLNSTEKCKTAAAILMTLPGTPYIYYGEETGMTGVKPDDRIREPFIWDNKDVSKNCSWEFTNNKKDAVAVNIQNQDSNSLLNFYKTFINLRNTNKALARGTFEVINQNDSNILAFKRSCETEEVYVLINTGSSSGNIRMPDMNAEILYSSDGGRGELSISGSLEIKKNQMLVIKKK